MSMMIKAPAKSEKRSKLRRFFRLVLMAAALCIAVLAILFVTVGIQVSLNPYRESLQRSMGESLSRDIVIEGDISLYLGLSPGLQLNKLTVENPKNWSGKTTRVAYLERFNASISLKALLDKKLDVEKFTVDGLDVTLEENSEGLSNWADLEEGEIPGRPRESTITSGLNLVDVRNLVFRDIQVTHFAEARDLPARYSLLRLEGTSRDEQGMSFDLSGSFRGEIYELSLATGSIVGFLSRQPGWPVRLDGNFAGLSIEAAGETSGAGFPENGYIDIHVAAKTLEPLAAALGTSLPALGEIDFSARVKDGKGGLRLENLKGNAGETSISGSLLLDRSETPPRVEGELLLGVIDIEMLTSGNKKGKEETGLRFPATGRMRLGIENLVNPKTSVNDVVLDCELTESSMSGDMSMILANVPMKGSVKFWEDEEGNANFNVDMLGKDSEIGDIYEFYSEGDDSVTGTFESIRFQNYGKGRNLAEAGRTAYTELDITNAELVKDRDGKKHPFFLDRGEIRGKKRQPTHHVGKGNYQGAPFDVVYIELKPKAAGPDVDPFMDFSGTIAGAELYFRGKFPRDDSQPLPPRDFGIEAERIGMLAAFANVPESADLPLSLSGQLIRKRDGSEINRIEGNLGNSNLTGTMRKIVDREKPLMAVSLTLDTLDVAAISAVFTTVDAEATEIAANTEGLNLDKATLPTLVKVEDLDLDLNVSEILLGKHSIDGFRFSGKVRDGKMETSPFSIQLGDDSLEGDLAADFSGTDPEATVNLVGRDLNMGALFSTFGLAEGMDLEVGTFGMHLEAKGKTLREGLLRSEIQTYFENGVWVLHDANTGARLPIAIERGDIEAEEGNGIRIGFDGRIGESPVRIEVITDALIALGKDAEQALLTIDAEVAGTRAKLDGTMALPFDGSDLDLQMLISGSKFSSLNDLLSIDLPPVGPFSLGGRFQLVDAGYSLSEMSMKLGSTDLNGDLKIDTKAQPPSLFVDLSSRTLQLDDFLIKGWSTTKPGDAAAGSARKKKKMVDPAQVNRDLQSASDEINKLLSSAILEKFNADISLKTGRVFSGSDGLGGGSLKMTLNDGQLSIDPLVISLPGGGDARITYQYHPSDSKYSGMFRVQVDKLDYGYLARRKDPAAKAAGILDIDLEIRGEGIPLDRRIIQNGSGYLNFRVHPENMDAKLFDLWATNLFIALLPKLDPKNNSTVNYVIGEFDLDSGVMSPKRLIIDTSKVRAEGTGTIDVGREKYDMRLEPTPKRPQLFSLEVPITINETFDKPKIGVGELGPAGIALRVAANFLSFPIKLVKGKYLPRDGSDISHN